MAASNPLAHASSIGGQTLVTLPGRDNLLFVVESLLAPLLLVISLWGIALYEEGELSPPYLILAVIAFSLAFPGSSRLGKPLWRVFSETALCWGWIAVLLLFLGFATGYIKQFSVQAIVAWLWVAPASVFAGHLVLRLTAPWVLNLQGSPQRAIVVGKNGQGLELARRVRDTPFSQIELSGFFDDRDESRLCLSGQFPLLGTLPTLSAYVKECRVQLIYLSLPMASQPRILHVLDELKDTTASIYFVPDMFITDLVQGRTNTVCGVPVISVCETPFTGMNGFVKRSSDIVISALILMLMSPLLLSIAVAIKLTSPGPVIFKQRRYGLDGSEILVYKFRSMTVCDDGNTIAQATRGDRRITRLGAFLRKTSLDELPQFVNVLQGRMSIVGPRPHAVAHNELYRKLIKGYMIRHKVKPGITGWAQVSGYRGETETLDEMQARIDHDLDYLRNWSLGLDIHIILKTIAIVFKDQAAY
ncbi:undecaprenyl-phosphate glucose phosphotransferase [Rhodocyclus tenuis]|uniref:undecaprenyl-phosphate glucose phosphotransferase n=1 Tax=Rhodocyclus tenuis TaxID=1066 RepID=UPI001908511F|nr:undecaprenyl-phosphate glucose phosphotransferase [Rhodocyclus tenuis]MBK1678894.1 undecaprenyl-phosphate glucose phosphotransferase [Rhodocyclus tenuis]